MALDASTLTRRDGAHTHASRWLCTHSCCHACRHTRIEVQHQNWHMPRLEHLHAYYMLTTVTMSTQHLNISTSQHLNISTSQHLNMCTLHLNLQLIYNQFTINQLSLQFITYGCGTLFRNHHFTGSTNVITWLTQKQSCKESTKSQQRVNKESTKS